LGVEEEEMNEAIKKLVDAVQQASPVVWNAAYRQVWIDGVENIIWLIASVVGCILLWKLAARLSDDRGDEVGIFFARLGSIVLVPVSLVFLACAIDCFTNPTFTAIKELKGLL